MRPAGSRDVPTLAELMVSFYAESGYVLDEARAARAFESLIADPRLGLVWIVQREAADVGYIVVTFVYGMEYGGLMAVVDDFYVRPDSRGRGLGTATLIEARHICAGRGIRAMSVRVAGDNVAAQIVYGRAGFAKVDDELMTLGLAEPTHIVPLSPS